MTPSQDRIDQVCDAFEQSWRDGHRPRIEDYLGQAEGAMRVRLWNELLLSELECRRRRGEEPTLEEYRQRFPDWHEALETHFQPSAPPLTVPAAPPIPPPLMTRIGQYQLVRKIGTGGMGEVYEGRHSLMKRRVAVKVLRRDVLGHPDAVARFHREIEAAARLSHPNIVQALDAAEADGLHFLVMEYVEGTDLQRLVDRDGPLPVAVACEYIRQAARGLQHAFERGLVHRDVKPANLLLADDGTIKVVDLGLASLDRMAAADPRPLTRAGLVVGTPDYLAPEQARQARSADIRSDVYSLGCTLYFLLTGRTPYPRGTLTETLLAHQSGKFRPVEAVRPEVPVALRAVLRRMMALQPGDRFATPIEVASALEPFVLSASQPPPPRPPRGRRMLLGGILLLATGILLVWLLGGPPRDGKSPEPAPSPLDRLTAVPRTESSSWWSEDLVGVLGDERWRHWTDISALAVSPEGELVASGGRNGLVNVWEARTGRRVVPLPGGGTVYGLAFTPGRGALVIVRDGSVRTHDISEWQEQALPDLPAGVGAAAASADGKQLALGFKDGRVLLVGLAGEGRREIKTRDKVVVNALAFNPTGSHLASGGADGSLHCWEAATGKARFVKDCKPGPVCSVTFCGEKKETLATGHEGGKVRLWDATSGEAQSSLSTARSATLWALAGSPTGPLLVAGSYEGMLSLWDTPRDKKGILLPAHHGSIAVLAFSPDGGTLFTAGHDPVIRSWDVKTRKERSPDRGSGSMVGAVAVAPDGQSVATACNDRGVRVWGIDGKEQGTLPRDFSSVGSVAFSPDGRWIVAGTSNGLRVWDRSTRKLHVPKRPIPGGDLYTAFTCDGMLLATANGKPFVRLWDVASGKEHETLHVSGRVTTVATAPRTHLSAIASGPQEKASTVVLWDWQGNKTTELPGHSRRVLAMAFNPSGEQLACGDGNTVKVWDTKSATVVHILEDHPGTVNGVVYASEGAALASADSEGSVVVWDAATGQERHRWRLPGKVNGLAVAPDGRHLVTANANGTAYILRVPR